MKRERDNFIDGYNYYVPSMQAAADLGQLLKSRVEFGIVLAVAAAGILSAQSIATAGNTSTFVGAFNAKNALGPYGRNITVVASGAATSAVTIIGRDYLGQPMRETLTLNGTTPVVGLKAFRYIDRIDYAATGATTINVGWGTRLGLPYKTRAVYREYENQAVAAAGTLNAPVTTDPQTATTGDPRGTYILTGTPDGVKVFAVDAEFDNQLNAAGRGGMHGIQHFNV